MRHTWRAALCSCTCWLAVSAWAQPTRPEAFGFVGAAHVSGDEGSLGNGLAAGGALTVPFTPRWALDFDVTHLRAERRIANFNLATRRTHLSPALQFRRGGDSLYGFVSGGVGAALQKRESGLQLNARGGVVKGWAGGWRVRADVFVHFRYVAPDVGARIGFGRLF